MKTLNLSKKDIDNLIGYIEIHYNEKNYIEIMADGNNNLYKLLGDTDEKINSDDYISNIWGTYKPNNKNKDLVLTREEFYYPDDSNPKEFSYKITGDGKDELIKFIEYAIEHKSYFKGDLDAEKHLLIKKFSEDLDDHVNDMAGQILNKLGATSGDITPDQDYEITQCEKRIIEILYKVAEQNVKC